MPANKVNKPAIPTAGPTWEELARMFAYLGMMIDDTKKPGRLFAQLATACQDIAAGTYPTQR
ncbi:hypothetical protein [Labrys okinawensis]|uniref:hypothetical protein n=1 Tax=Labrys okinawensis TaxID=346911 RepID=UPI0011B240C8|nr:hypothetical protein [Labrys okinawensis]